VAPSSEFAHAGLTYVATDCEVAEEVQPPYSFDNCWQLPIACFVTWSEKDGYLDWLAGEGEALLQYLSSFDVVTGYNVIRFDFRVLDGDIALSRGIVPTLDPRKSMNTPVPRITQAALKGKMVDILLDISDELGHRLKAEQVFQATLRRGKTMDGADAPRRWKQGRRLEVIQYCRDDVALEKDIYLVARDRGEISYQDRKRGVRKTKLKLRIR
jgi:DEAD/DEAH box helicase domain-containing protein